MNSGDIDQISLAKSIPDRPGTREFDCDHCGSTVVRQSKNLTGEHLLCSDDCLYEWLSETFTGEGHPNWKGGSTQNYGRGWQRVRKLALERDGHACVVCGATKAELGRNLDVHHIVPVRASVETPVATEFDAHHLENVVCLCPACHRKAEFGQLERAELPATPS
ncbi:MAG: HNH endonuclease [Halobacteriota archaeon]|uniref:HNH endonuclease n=1 Tax=Natronomonas sp. TaxID=2184060 RepID=UPI003977165C